LILSDSPFLFIFLPVPWLFDGGVGVVPLFNRASLGFFPIAVGTSLLSHIRNIETYMKLSHREADLLSRLGFSTDFRLPTFSYRNILTYDFLFVKFRVSSPEGRRFVASLFICAPFLRVP